MRFKSLLLTDHRSHTTTNSTYALAAALAQDPVCDSLDVASAGMDNNSPFFRDRRSDSLWVVDSKGLSYTTNGQGFINNPRETAIGEYDVVFLRIPPPFDLHFAQYLESKLSPRRFVNSPQGIINTGSKAFLQNFPEITPPSMLCRTPEDVADAIKQYGKIVLKPIFGYGGKGILRIEEDRVDNGKSSICLDKFLRTDLQTIYLAIKFLENIHLGDKRIYVAGGIPLGSSLRIPAQGTWLANHAQGAKLKKAPIDENEHRIIEIVDPVLRSMGVLYYGLDTLVDNQGRRVLSEINVASVGGLVFPETTVMFKTEKPLPIALADHLWKNIANRI